MKATVNQTAAERNITLASLADIQPNVNNPRKFFNETALGELAESIRQQGILQPITVRPIAGTDRYEIVFGERRYRASLIAGMEEIPVIVQELTDDEAEDIAITENLQREDITPMEEANAYKRLIDTQRYDAATLAARFGKSESYIYTRLRFTALIPEIATLLDKEEITVSVAAEICKYDEDIQREVYSKHLENENDNYNCWRELKATEVAKRIKDTYTTALSQYKFDLSSCSICRHNTNTQRLFVDSGDCGSCMDKACLCEKNKLFLVGKAVRTIQQQPDIQLCASEYNTDGEAVQMLVNAGYEVERINYTKPFPRSPKQPDREQFTNDKTYEEAKRNYESEWADYNGKIENIQERKEKGEVTVYAEIGIRDVTFCYVVRTAEQQAQEKTTPLQALEQKDVKNKEIAHRKTVEDTKQLIHKADLTKGRFTTEEEKMLYFFMLSNLQSSHYTLAGFPDNTHYLTDELKLQVVQNLTKEAKNIIRRDFIVAHFGNANGESTISELLLNFTRHHLPDQLRAIEETHNEVYEKRHLRLEERKAVILVQEQARQKAEKAAAAEAPVQVPEHEEVAA